MLLSTPPFLLFQKFHSYCDPSISCTYSSFGGFSVAQMVKNLPAIQETWVQSPGQEDPLEKGTATSYPLQYSCLENPVDRGAWQTAVHRVAKSQTQLSD